MKWYPIPGFPNYQFSFPNMVRVISRTIYRIPPRGGPIAVYHYKGKVLKITVKKDGYHVVGLYNNSVQKNVGIHRIVAWLFLGECPEGKEVNHKDGNKANNVPENLEYVTRSENIKHAHAIGLHNNKYSGERHHLVTLSDEQVREIYRLCQSGIRKLDIARIYKVSKTTIKDIAKKKTRKKALVGL